MDDNDNDDDDDDDGDSQPWQESTNLRQQGHPKIASQLELIKYQYALARYKDATTFENGAVCKNIAVFHDYQ